MNPQQAAALTAALNLLAAQVSGLPAALIAAQQQPGQQQQQGQQQAPPPPKSQPAPSGTPGKGGGAMAVVDVLIASLGKLFGPLIQLGTYLNASTSGFAIFQKSLQLFAATVAPVMLPAFVLLATLMAATSEVLWNELFPAFEGFARFILQTGIPAIVNFIDVISGAAKALAEFADDIGTGIGDFAQWLGVWEREPTPGGPAATAAGAPEGTRGVVDRKLKDVLAELELSMGPQASSGSIASVYSRAQMSVLSQSPFEREMLAIARDTLKAIRGAAAPVPGAGTYTPTTTGRGGGAGGGGFDAIIDRTLDRYMAAYARVARGG